MSLFDQLRTIPALELAERAGLILKRRGSRSWACCPIHGEKTPSLCFYPEGTWHCFGCGTGGDAVAFYAALNKISQGEAARRLAEEQGITGELQRPRGLTVGELRRDVERHFNARWCLTWRTYWAADRQLREYRDDSAWDDPKFVALLKAREYAAFEMDWMLAMDDERGRIDFYREGGASK